MRNAALCLPRARPKSSETRGRRERDQRNERITREARWTGSWRVNPVSRERQLCASSNTEGGRQRERALSALFIDDEVTSQQVFVLEVLDGGATLHGTLFESPRRISAAALFSRRSQKQVCEGGREERGRPGPRKMNGNRAMIIT